MLIAVAADKGAPGVTTTAVALAAVWPRPVLLAECDPAGGDLVYRLPGEGGGRLDPRRGLLSLAVAARRDLQPTQLWAHAQKLRGGLDVLLGVTSAEQGAGLEPLWGPVGSVLAGLPQADVIADCGRLGPDGAYYDLLAHAAAVVLVTRPSLGEVVRLRDRAAAVSLAVRQRGGQDARIGVLVVADHRVFSRALAEVGQVLGTVSMLGGIAFEPRSAELLRGEWGGRLDKSLLIRTAREVAGQLAGPPTVASGRRAAAAAPARRAGRAGDPAPGVDPRPGVSPLPIRGGPGHGGAAHSGGPAQGGGSARGGSAQGGGARHAAGRAPASVPPAELFGPPPTGHPPTGHPPTGHPPTDHPPTGHPGAGHPGADLSAGDGLPSRADLSADARLPGADLPAAEPGGW
ncbi:MAG TPA: hypothetical protein VE464_20390 [Streptosporangiaceae bacterium]|nr:hypothetical protein [Streptosporangiaceae bacterium]